MIGKEKHREQEHVNEARDTATVHTYACMHSWVHTCACICGHAAYIADSPSHVLHAVSGCGAVDGRDVLFCWPGSEVSQDQPGSARISQSVAGGTPRV